MSDRSPRSLFCWAVGVCEMRRYPRSVPVDGEAQPPATRQRSDAWEIAIRICQFAQECDTSGFLVDYLMGRPWYDIPEHARPEARGNYRDFSDLCALYGSEPSRKRALHPYYIDGYEAIAEALGTGIISVLQIKKNPASGIHTRRGRVRVRKSVIPA